MTRSTADPALVALVRTAQEQDFPAAVTLVTAGGTVSGALIGRDEWVGKFFERSDAGEGSEPILDALREAFAAEDTAGGPDEPIQYAFIHLEGARVHGHGPDLENPEPDGLRALWRGRVDQVVGWSIGSPSGPPTEQEPVFDSFLD
ncbi:hypothetical protein AB1207_01190 [Kineococcus endophyticus]|uniref:Uncharacterized protein n=1 Tax=Kineococcus endophyticus TaxID=1181883 RepID=A0ABV3P1B6_9ACTN